jgi:hypothetical protein
MRPIRRIALVLTVLAVLTTGVFLSGITGADAVPSEGVAPATAAGATGVGNSNGIVGLFGATQ